MTRDEHRQVLRGSVSTRSSATSDFVPMLFERSERVCTETNPAHGGYTKHTRPRPPLRHDPRSAGRCSDRRAAVDQHASAAFCSPARPSVYDKVLNRECSFGLGFMTELRQHTFVGDRCGSRGVRPLRQRRGTTYAFRGSGARPRGGRGVQRDGRLRGCVAASPARCVDRALPGPRGSRCRWSRTGVGHRAECPPLFPYAPPPRALRPCAPGVTMC